ncbi:MAG: hypothetical protein CVV02_00545 [Firmicutes bacterium HGW-Firmicutes-7]|nr:MAG: hypothetical protein CVV02_00545 [Firmicutes bacterium HGW-Firmicutes-7]
MNRNLKAAIGIIAVGSLVVSLGTGAFAGTQFRRSAPDGDTQMNVSAKASTEDESTLRLRGEGKRLNQNGFGNKAGRGVMGGAGGYGTLFDTDALETAGLITTAQATEINDFISKHEAERLELRQQLESMTQEERQIYFDNQINVVRVNLQEELVSNNILTQNELDMIQEYMQDQRLTQHQTKLSTGLEAFVTDGTITQDEADEIVAYMSDVREQHQEEMAELKGKTAEEMKEYFELQESKGNLLTIMVNDNVITQTQADALATVLCQGSKGGRGLGL